MTKKHEPVTITGGIPIQFSDLVGHPIELKIRRKLAIQPGKFAGEIGTRPEREKAGANDYAPTLYPLE